MVKTCPQCHASLSEGASSCPSCGAYCDEDATLEHTSGPQTTWRQSLDEALGTRYRVIGKLGSGAFGEVYETTDTVLNRKVAIKRIRLDALADETQIDEVKLRFLREAQVAAQLKHPNIVTIHDIVSTPTMSFIVMEIIDGVTLQSVLQSKTRLSLSETLEVLSQVADALDHAHQHKVVHRDVKPANIMIEDSGRVKVTDFGIAKAESSGNLTATGSILGTPNYMSPEQAQGKVLDGRSDLFSLGCILYECLTGVKPFRGENVTAVLLRILNEDPPPIDYEKTGLPPAVDRVVHRALAKKPLNRFPSGGAFVQALRAVPSVDHHAATIDLGATRDTPSRPPSTGRHSSADSTLPVSSTPVAEDKSKAPVTVRRAAPGPKKKTRGQWMAIAAGVLAVVVAGSWWRTQRLATPSGTTKTPVPGDEEASRSPRAVTEIAETVPEPSPPPPPPTRPESTQAEMPPVPARDTEQRPAQPGPSETTRPPPSEGTIQANEKAVADLLVRISKMQARAKGQTGRYLTAQQLLQRRRAMLGIRNRGNQWLGHGYRFVLETPKKDFYFAAAIPIEYGKSGVRSFYIDPRGVLRGGDKGGGNPSPSDPVTR